MKTFAIMLTVLCLLCAVPVIAQSNDDDVALAQLQTRLQTEAELSADDAAETAELVQNQYRARIEKNSRYRLNADLVVAAAKEIREQNREEKKLGEITMACNDGYNEALKSGLEKKEAARLAKQACLKTYKTEKNKGSLEQNRFRKQLSKELKKQAKEEKKARHRKEKAEARRARNRGEGKGKGQRPSDDQRPTGNR